MGNKFKYLAIFLNIFAHFSSTSGDTYNVQVGTELYVNLVDSKFLSFTVDPKYLFSSIEKYDSKECLCMATSLTPAYIHIAGISTSRLFFQNTTIYIDDRGHNSKLHSDDGTREYKNQAVARSQWKKFFHWAKTNGFDLVFALNSHEKSATGMWDPNSALKILTEADKANIGDIHWQLGYECTNQSIEEYLNDLETLRVIVETFPSGKAGRWRVVGGDVTHCLQADSKSDFKDYVTLSNDMMDAILLNGNSSSKELERMSERDRFKLLKLLSTSDTPLWLTEHSQMVSELERAADWMTSLGYSARNGFSVHYRELTEKELYEPSLSFYMALLFKNLVGERVLHVDIEASQAILFAHCTSLRRKPVPGAVTFYGANMDEEPARFSIMMAKKEQGGDIMQFILGHDRSGNIVVNGRPMYYEGDIRPTVKRVRPFKRLLINLPPKSFGFWVLANTMVQACYDSDNNKNKTINTNSVNSEDKEDDIFFKTKRLLIRTNRDVDATNNFEELIAENDDIELSDVDLRDNIYNINNHLEEDDVFLLPKDDETHNRSKRQGLEEKNEKETKTLKKVKFNLQNGSNNYIYRNHLNNKLSKLSKDLIKRTKNGKIKTLIDKYINNKFKRYLKRDITSHKRNDKVGNDEIQLRNIRRKKDDLTDGGLVRNRRNINPKNKLKYEEDSSENEIDVGDKETFKLGNFFHKLKKLSELPLEMQEKDENNDYDEKESSEGIVLKTKILDDSAVIDISEKSHTGLLKSTLQDILSLLADFNKNLNRLWAAMTLLD